MLRIILIAILLLIIARAFWRLMDGILEAASGKPSRRVEPGVKLERDPVCGTHVAPGSSRSLTSGGTTHYFCSDECRAEFIKRL